MKEILNNEFEIEIDVDGVMADMDGNYAQYISDIIPDFTEETHIFEWGIPDIARDFPEAAKRITALYSDYNFIRNLPRYPGVEEGLNRLYNLIKSLGVKGKIVIHTHMRDENVAKARREWLEDLKQDTKVDFEIDICVGSQKNMRKNSLALIEDNVRNCSVSDARYKFLIRRGHNRKYNECDLGYCQQGFVSSDLLDAVIRLEELFNNILMKECS